MSNVQLQNFTFLLYPNGNGVQLFQRKAIIDLARATNHSITALLSLHILQLLYSMGLRFFGLQRKMPLRRTHQEKVIVYNTLLDRMNINEVNIHIISVFETPWKQKGIAFIL